MDLALPWSMILSRSNSMARDQCGRQPEVYSMWHRGVPDGRGSRIRTLVEFTVSQHHDCGPGRPGSGVRVWTS